MREEGEGEVKEEGGTAVAGAEQPASPVLPIPPTRRPALPQLCWHPHCGDNVPMPQAGPGGTWWGRGAGGATRAALSRMGWCRESAAKQQP